MDVLMFNSNQKFQNKFKCKAFYLAQNRIRCIEHLKRRHAIVINELNNKQIWSICWFDGNKYQHSRDLLVLTRLAEWHCDVARPPRRADWILIYSSQNVGQIVLSWTTASSSNARNPIYSNSNFTTLYFMVIIRKYQGCPLHVRLHFIKTKILGIFLVLLCS